MSSIAIITARGGSKRIPNKNVRLFCGRPILAYSIEAALGSGLFEEVMVSTDSAEIAELAKKLGASVPFLRSPKNSDDYAVTADVLQEVLEAYQDRQNRSFEIVCCIYPTAPFVTAQKLRAAYETLVRSQANSLMPVVRFSFPPQRGLVINDGCLQYQFPENEFVRSQDLCPIYHDCGQFYFCRVKTFQKYHTLTTPGTIPLIMPEEEVQDIDTLTDWELAEIKYRTFVLNER